MSRPVTRKGRKKSKPWKSLIADAVAKQSHIVAWHAFSEAVRANPNGYVSMPMPAAWVAP